MKITEMFKGADGKLSAMRVCSIFIVVCVMGIFVSENIVSMVKGNGSLITISWELVSLVTAVMGVKAYQHKNEMKNSVDNDNDSDTNGGGPLGIVKNVATSVTTGGPLGVIKEVSTVVTNISGSKAIKEETPIPAAIVPVPPPAAPKVS
jgi:xanthosine utilization system XapX-like protein